MRQYTTPEQTAKLIELGLPKPKGWTAEDISSRLRMCVDINRDEGFNYSIGELLSILPRYIETPYDTAVLEISYESDDGEWYCGHRWYYNRGWRLFGNDYKTIDDTELVDALYRYIVELKEEGVI